MSRTSPPLRLPAFFFFFFFLDFFFFLPCCSLISLCFLLKSCRA